MTARYWEDKRAAAHGSAPGDGGEAVGATPGNIAILQRGLTVLQIQRDEARATALREAADAWMVEGRAVIHNHAGRDLTALQRIAQWMRDRADAAAPVEPEDGGEAVRREVAAWFRRWNPNDGHHDQWDAWERLATLLGLTAAQTEAFKNTGRWPRSTWSAAAAAVRERREGCHCDGEESCRSCSPVAAPVGGRSQDEQERP